MNNSSTRIALIKLAAIGDVTMACRALSEIASRYETSFVIHWIIDERLQPLARRLLTSEFTGARFNIEWHSINSRKLFQGSRSEKASEALRLFKTVALIRPAHVALLHRDWRYKALLRLAFTGRFFSPSEHHSHEIDNYSRCLEHMARALRMRALPIERTRTRIVEPSGRIGLLVGGAQNQKLTYEEKRWPHLARFIELVLARSDRKIALFGGPDDVALADKIMHGVSQIDRVENLVGKYQLDELPERLASLDAFVGIDSGPAHIAAAVMTAPHQRVVSMFGPTDPLVWAPRANGSARLSLLYKAPECSPCYHDDGNFKPCPLTGDRFRHCMNDITAEEVYAALSD